MEKYSGVLLCTDFDNTLYDGESIPDNNIKAIKQFTDNGGLFTVVSGRKPDFICKYAKETSLVINAPLINLNGAIIYDATNKKIIKEGFLRGIGKDIVDRIFDEIPTIESANIFDKYQIRKIDRDDRTSIKEEYFEEIYKITFRVEDDAKISDAAMDKIKSIVGDGYEVLRSTYPCIEILSPMLTKGRSVRFLKEYLGADKLVCVGDFENDISMVKEADIGYAVANSIQSLKDVADRVTVSVNEGALARIIEEL